MVNRNIKAAPGMDDVFFIYGDPILYFKPYSVFSASLFLQGSPRQASLPPAYPVFLPQILL